MIKSLIAAILETIPRMFNIIWSLICAPIYYLISVFYNVFIGIPQVDILNDIKIEDIYERITMIIVIVMAFYISFSVVKYVVDPNAITDKEKGTGSMVRRIILVILMLAFVPQIFSIAYDLQGKIIDSDVIPKIILGEDGATDGNLNNRGSEFSANLFGMFYTLNEQVCGSGENSAACEEGQANIDKSLEMIRSGFDGNYGQGVSGIMIAPITSLQESLGLTKSTTITNDDGTETTAYVIKFEGLLALLVGGFVLWTLIVYGVELAKRYFQLIYLQIVAPIAIMSYLSPKKDGMFAKWTKQCLTTYIDLFIRLSIINFILLIIDLLYQAFDFKNATSGLQNSGWIYLFLIFGLFSFAKKAPKMLAELLPSMGGAASNGFGIGIKDGAGKTIRQLGGAALGTAAMAGQGIAAGIKQGKRRGGIGENGKPLDARKSRNGAIMGGIRGGITGAYRGATSGYKDGSFIKNMQSGMETQATKSKEFGNRMENGYTLGAQMEDRYRNVTGQKSRVAELESKKEPLKSQNDAYDKIWNANKSMRDEAKKHVVEEGKGRFSGDYKQALTKARDLREDSRARAQFTVGKYSSQEEADTAYSLAVQRAKDSVNRSNFVKQESTGTFAIDEKAYQVACEREAKKVSKEEFYAKVSEGTYRTQAEAEAAYNVAVQEAIATVDKDDYKKEVVVEKTDQEAYEAARDRAAKSVDKKEFDSQVSKYKTQAEAEAAYKLALAQADAEVDELEKKAINDYITHGEWNLATGTYKGEKDAKIQQIQEELIAELNKYNKNAKDENKVAKLVLAEGKDKDGNTEYVINEITVDSTTGKEVIKSYNGKEFHNFAKEQSSKKSENVRKITEIDGDIATIKEQTAGSGIKINDNND